MTTCCAGGGQDRAEHGSSDPLHGVTLKSILARLVEHYGWEEMGRSIDIRCFTINPDMQSSLKFLRRTPWARKKVEQMYLGVCRT
jgi:uncharacterized protein (DUF2132 family)